MGAGVIRTGIGGWTFEPWRGVFYPHGLKQAAELEYASRKLATIEINGTYYSSFKPDSWAKWRAATPDGFRFSVKASRYCTNRKVLTDGRESIDRFLNQGLVELGDRLGPILWQFMATKKFDRDEFSGFLDLLPDKLEGLGLRHVLEVRHASFADEAFVRLCRDRGVAICTAAHATYPLIPDVTADFAYLRLMTADDSLETGYPADELDAWAGRLKEYARGDVPAEFAMLDRTGPMPQARDVYAYVIHEGKVRAPSAAMELQARV
jgi:uncharacterized protein YecE (DUF72 family)